jgi:hypothetical protein
MRAEALLLNGAAQGVSHLVSALPPSVHDRVHVGSCGVTCSMAGASVGIARGVLSAGSILCPPVRAHAAHAGPCAAVTVFTNLTYSDAVASAASITWLSTAQGSAPVVKGSVK